MLKVEIALSCWVPGVPIAQRTHSWLLDNTDCLLCLYYFREKSTTDTRDVVHCMIAKRTMKMSLHSRRETSLSSWLRRQRTITGWRESWSLILTGEDCSPHLLSTCWQTDPLPCPEMWSRAVQSCDPGWWQQEVVKVCDSAPSPAAATQHSSPWSTQPAMHTTHNQWTNINSSVKCCNLLNLSQWPNPWCFFFVYWECSPFTMIYQFTSKDQIIQKQFLLFTYVWLVLLLLKLSLISIKL